MAPTPGHGGWREYLFEIVLAVLCSAVWILATLGTWGLLSLAGQLSLGFYPFFSIAAALGWLAGNVYVHRWSRRAVEGYRRRALLLYLVGPPSFLYLIRALAPLADQRQAPLVPLLGFAVYGVFFLLPLTLKPPKIERRR